MSAFFDDGQETLAGTDGGAGRRNERVQPNRWVVARGSWLRGRSVDRVECLWEPGMGVAARLRHTLGAPGLTPEQTVAFRDKQRMKEVLDGGKDREDFTEREQFIEHVLQPP